MKTFHSLVVIFFIVGLFFCSCNEKKAGSAAAENLQLSSPNGKIIVRFILSGGLPFYSASYNGKTFAIEMYSRE
ncbi:MAG: glycoside hydrolase family 97 N-terminal domain-containing protein [Bacteroidetes bacterium]|nr:glycoside hydrolase family 97 N-terminal domain-containing protein [Bacteroidota bacterium]